jgi:hypothetical protein
MMSVMSNAASVVANKTTAGTRTIPRSNDVAVRTVTCELISAANFTDSKQFTGELVKSVPA